jgi:hypothetical protein
VSIEILSIASSNIQIEVVRKDIKNMHLAVYPPTGRIRLAAPYKTDSEVMRLFAISKIGWIKKNIKNFNEQPREASKEFISGESHYFFGKRYLIQVIEHSKPNSVQIKGVKTIQLFVRPNSTTEQRAALVKEWYRKELKRILPTLIMKWEKALKLKCNYWGVKQMRTKWGTCNHSEKRIWLNLELAKKPMICIDYVVLHELLHFIEPNHSDKFIALLNKHFPKWKKVRQDLNNLPI